jgi:thiol-disulfide isomerase/thioredoxin
LAKEGSLFSLNLNSIFWRNFIINYIEVFKLRVVLLFTLAVFLPGCDSDEETGPNIKSLLLTLSKSKIVADGIDFAKVIVVNQAGTDVMDYVTVYYDGKPVSGNKIVSSAPSVSTVYAMYENVKSNETELAVVEDKNLKFEKNVLLEQYTGTWCGYCPRAMAQISDLQKTDNKIVHVSYHLSDEFAYQFNLQLFQSFGFTGIPTVHADRDIVWQGEVSSISALHDPSRIGMSLEVTGNSIQISADVNIKFGYDFTNSLLLSVFLLHDSLVADQANYYNDDASSVYYKAGNPMPKFIHRNVMIIAGTDMFGDLIPSASTDLGAVYNKKISFMSFRCDDIRKMTVVAFIVSGSGDKTGEVLNCIKAKVGQKQEFVYDDD